MKFQTVSSFSTVTYDVKFANKHDISTTDNYYNISQFLINKLKSKLGLVPIEIKKHIKGCNNE